MEWNLKYIVVYLSFGIAVEAARSYRDCPPLKLTNGFVRLRPSGRMAKFRCNYPYKLVGNSYAQCTSGRWEVPMPICIKAGCKDLPAIANGIHDITHDGSLARFVCHYGFELEGPREIYCNGYRWNDTVPKCRGTKEVSKLSCNFDSGSCGWEDDELHDFNWRRKVTGPNVTQLIWWPASDHTNSTGQGGYMYIERQSMLSSQTALLLSPSYHADLTKNGCFTFYYYRNNPYLDKLKVYQKPDSINMTTLTTTVVGQQYLRFETARHSFGRWSYGFFHFNETDEDFQIVIEGSTNIFRGSFLAVDDVMILQGQQCIINITSESTPLLDFRYSCANRCRPQSLTSEKKTRFLSLMLQLNICGCDESCLQTDSCCADFRDLCEFSTEDTTTVEETTESVTVRQTTRVTKKIGTATTNIAITYPSSRNLVTYWTYRRPTSKQPNPRANGLTTFGKRGSTIWATAKQTKTIPFLNYNTSVPIIKMTTAWKTSTVPFTTTPIPISKKPIVLSTKKVMPPLTPSKTNKQVTFASTEFSSRSTVPTTTNTMAIFNLTSTTSHILRPTILPRPYEADGKTAQANETINDLLAERRAEDEKAAYSNRMHVTTICVAVFLCICGSSILIMYIVTRRYEIRSLITRLGIRHEYSKSSHVGKEGEVRFLIREDEVDLE